MLLPKKLKIKLKQGLIFNAIKIPTSEERLPLTISKLTMLKELYKYYTLYLTDPSKILVWC
jgi:hypothetical protein